MSTVSPMTALLAEDCSFVHKTQNTCSCIFGSCYGIVMHFLVRGNFRLQRSASSLSLYLKH